MGSRIKRRLSNGSISTQKGGIEMEIVEYANGNGQAIQLEEEVIK